MQLIIGNKNYSTWSLRPWALMTHFNLTFDEKMIKLFSPTMKADMVGLCPSSKVPALIDSTLQSNGENIHVWDSLAICEYVNEVHLNGKAWPKNIRDKANARAIANEMHSGFTGIRNELPMNIRRPISAVTNDELTEQAIKDIARVFDIWHQALSAKKSDQGDFLFGDFSIADAMYLPVVSRFHTYGIAIPDDKSATITPYMQAMLSLPAFKKWTSEALQETDIIEEDERK